MKNKADYSKYECPYSHLEKESGHELHGPEGYQDVYSVWCTCGFRAPVFYLDPDELGLKLKGRTDDSKVEEIEELEKGLELFTRGGYTRAAHFEMVAHYGDTRDYQEIPIGREYNDRFISLVKEIIKEKEQMLKERSKE